MSTRTEGLLLEKCHRCESTGRIGSLTQALARANGAGAWVLEDVPFNALYDAAGRLTSLQAQGASPVFQWGHTYSYEANGNRTGGSITANGASMGFTSGVQSGTNRQSTVAGITVSTNAAGDITALLGKTLAYDAAGRLSEATAVPPCPSGLNCSGAQTTTSRFNGWGQRFLRENDQEESVFSYGLEGHNLLSQTTRNLVTSALSTTEHIYLPTASGPMPVAAVIDGTVYAVHSDHLNTPRRLSDSTGQTRWQWPYSGFGEITPQSTPAAGQASVNYALRYPGQVDDGNGLFYNWHRFYDPRVGRYTSADPIGLEGGFNRFAYVDGNPLSFFDVLGLAPDGHHWVIGPIRNDPDLSPDARKVFRDAKTGYYGERHGWDKEHSQYNKGVQDLWNSKNYNPSCMTKDQADDFVKNVKQSSDPRIYQYRNLIYRKVTNWAIRRLPFRGGSNE